MRSLTYRHNPRVFVSRIALACLFVCSMSLLAHPCHGQAQQPAAAPEKKAAKPAAAKPPAVPVKYDELPCKEGREKERTAITKLLKNTAPSAADSAKLKTYLQEYGLARWTVKSHAHEVLRFRLELRTNFKRIRSPQTYDQVNEFALGMLSSIAKGNYSPVARVNAMLAIGDLNLREPPRSTEDAVPLPRALPLMLDAYADPGQIDGVRLAALLGILRHVNLGIADAQVRNSRVLPVMLELAKTNQPPDGRSAEGHAWFRVRAMETLGALAVAGQQGEVANALADVAAEEESPLWVRCAAARFLGKLDYSDPAGMTPGSFLAKLTQLATAICNQEVATLDKLKKDELNSGRKAQGPAGFGGMDMMDMGGGPGADAGMMDMAEMGGMLDGMMDGPGGVVTKKEEDSVETRRIKGSQRRLKAQMLSVLTGLGAYPRQDEGIRAGIHVLITDPDQETLLGKLTGAISALLAVLDGREELDSVGLDEAIAAASDEIGQVLASTSTDAEEEQPPAETTTAPAAAPVTP